MISNKLRTTIIAFALALAAASAVSAQQSQPTPRPAPSDNFVEHKSFQSMVFPVRNRDPETLLPVLRMLTSGHKGAGVSSDRTFRVITVRDFPENVASIEEAIKRLDTPEAPRPDVELRMHVLLASTAAAAGGEPPPADLRDVLTQLQTTLNFKSYQLLTSVVQRTKESRGRESGYIEGKGTAQSASGGGERQSFVYNFAANSLSLTPAASGATTVQLGGFNFHIGGSGVQAHVRSDLSLREGEQVVVGTAGMGSRALILVMTARTLK
jgi:hypothetical protein